MNKKQAFIFFGIILAGLGYSLYHFDVFGLKKGEGDAGEGGPGENGKSEPGEIIGHADPKNPGPDPEAPGGSETKKPDPEPEPPVAPPSTGGYESPSALANALVEKLMARDVAGFMALAGEGAVSDAIRPQVEGLLKAEGWAPDPETPISELAKSTAGARWTIHLQQVGPSSSNLTTELYADLAKPTDEKAGWTVKKITLPLDFAEKTGLAPGASIAGTTPGTPENPAGVAGMPDTSDALAVAHAFSRAVVGRDFALARRLTDSERVTDERVAALMIALEEGAFRLREDRPLVVTLSRDDLTWVLTRVDSGAAGSEFAVEMGKGDGADEDWKIHGLTFSKLIATLASQAGAGGVAYAPIVADPQGGDSLVLYFEFDDDGVSQRTARQLSIVADIVSSDPTKKILINGHADAKGSDQYNEELGGRRAAAIRSQLIEFGVNSDQVVTESFGEARPRRPNFNPDGSDNPANRSQNRRAEVYLDF